METWPFFVLSFSTFLIFLLAPIRKELKTNHFLPLTPFQYPRHKNILKPPQFPTSTFLKCRAVSLGMVVCCCVLRRMKQTHTVNTECRQSLGVCSMMQGFSQVDISCNVSAMCASVFGSKYPLLDPSSLL